MEGRFEAASIADGAKRQAFDDVARDAFGAAYPSTSLALRHDLSSHPLFHLDALASLGSRMPADLLEYNRGDIEVSQPDETVIPKNGLSIEETIRNIGVCGSWACFHNIEVDHAYKQLMNECLAEIEPMVRPATGELWKPEAYVFISSPNAVTPYHFDPQYNILMQIAGTKKMAVLPADNETLTPNEAHEYYHRTGLANLPYNEEIAKPLETIYEMGPGDAVYIPLKAPHWVNTGPSVSVSFSITWRSEASDRQRRVYRVNHYLRQAGLNPGRFGAAPMRDRAKGIMKK